MKEKESKDYQKMLDSKDKIFELANDLVFPSDIAVIIGIDKKVLLNELKYKEDSEITKTFYSGFTQKAVELKRRLDTCKPKELELMQLRLSELGKFRMKLIIELD